MAMRVPGEDDDGEHLAEINITPLIDVMLVLLIVFMVAAPLSTVDIPVDLPTSNAAPAPRPDDPLYVTIDRALVWSVGESATTPDGLAAALDAATRGKRDRRLFLRADRSVPYGEVMKLTDRLREAGYLRVALVGLEGRP
jgi:TonB system transport protein ExbD (group 1)